MQPVLKVRLRFSLDSMSTERNGVCLVLFSFLWVCLPHTLYAYCTHTHTRCEGMWAHMPPRHRVKPPHLAASSPRGIKQTVIDLRYDCLFCCAVSDGWRFARVWKVCVKYGGERRERGGGGCFKINSPQGEIPAGAYGTTCHRTLTSSRMKCPP